MINTAVARETPSALQPRFPTVQVLGQTYQPELYQGQHLPDDTLAFDAETTPIQGREIPELALGTVCGDRGSCYLVHPDQLPALVLAGADQDWICHHAVFDFWVAEQYLRTAGQQQALATWWQIAAQGRLHCTMILERLIALARIDEHPGQFKNLAVLAGQIGVELDKADPYRLRCGELLGLPAAVWGCLEPGFWSYAIQDSIATLLIWQHLTVQAEILQPSPADLLPGAVERFGLLTESLQVRGAIALDAISRTGVQVDLDQVHKVQARIDRVVQAQGERLEQLGQELGAPELFKRRKRTGEIYRTASGVPRKNAKQIKAVLEQIGRKLHLRPRRNQDGLVTDSVAYWSQHADDHPFLSCYCTWSEQAKLAQFFSKLGAERIYPRYTAMVRTGRSSCSAPNLQQLPRQSSFREMICAAPGHWLLAIDYSTLELRTLAQVCLHRYGRSATADVFRAGGDPHTHTAALLQGMTAEQFQGLPADQQKQDRQRAKAVNFGVPGGLGAAALMAMAKTGYGVEMTLEEAQDLRRRLLYQVYPELAQYLQEDRARVCAANMLAPVDAVRAALPDRALFPILFQILSDPEAVAAHGQKKVDFAWEYVAKLNRNPDLAAALEQRRPSEQLARRVLFGYSHTLSGRVRGHVRFTARCNTPFQGLAADGAKLALFELVCLGYRVCGFVHDEVLLEIPEHWDLDKTYQHVEQVLCSTMQELTPDIPIAAEGLIGDRWYKGVDGNERDEQGRLVPYRRDNCTEKEDSYVTC